MTRIIIDTTSTDLVNFIAAKAGISDDSAEELLSSLQNASIDGVEAYSSPVELTVVPEPEEAVEGTVVELDARAERLREEDVVRAVNALSALGLSFDELRQMTGLSSSELEAMGIRRPVEKPFRTGFNL